MQNEKGRLSGRLFCNSPDVSGLEEIGNQEAQIDDGVG